MCRDDTHTGGETRPNHSSILFGFLLLDLAIDVQEDQFLQFLEQLTQILFEEDHMLSYVQKRFMVFRAESALMNTYLSTEEWRETLPILAIQLCTNVLVVDPVELEQRSEHHRDIHTSHRSQARVDVRERSTSISTNETPDESKLPLIETNADYRCPSFRERGTTSETASNRLFYREVLLTRRPQKIIGSPETQRL
jgi:hypothetical protein